MSQEIATQYWTIAVAIVAIATLLIGGAWYLAHRAGLADVARRVAVEEKRRAEFLAWQKSLTPEEWAAWWSASLRADVMGSANYCPCQTGKRCLHASTHCH